MSFCALFPTLRHMTLIYLFVRFMVLVRFYQTLNITIELVKPKLLL